jgi:hypothetical protein
VIVPDLPDPKPADQAALATFGAFGSLNIAIDASAVAVCCFHRRPL